MQDVEYCIHTRTFDRQRTVFVVRGSELISAKMNTTNGYSFAMFDAVPLQQGLDVWSFVLPLQCNAMEVFHGFIVLFNIQLKAVPTLI